MKQLLKLSLNPQRDLSDILTLMANSKIKFQDHEDNLFEEIVFFNHMEPFAHMALQPYGTFAHMTL